jgi:DNA-binding PadR family transcriptional regulator
MERELLLLGLLRRADMHGYQLHEFIERDLATCTPLKRSTAYFLLDKMTRLGWVAQREEREGHRPPRHVYQVTPAGEAQFQCLLRENLASHTITRFPGDAGLMFADALPPVEALALLGQRRTALEADLASVRGAPPHAGAPQLIIEHRIAHLEAELRWLEKVLDRLAQELGIGN